MSRRMHLVAACAMCAALTAAATADAKPTDVFVTNTSGQPVPASIVGTPTVAIDASTPVVTTFSGVPQVKLDSSTPVSTTLSGTPTVKVDTSTPLATTATIAGTPTVKLAPDTVVELDPDTVVKTQEVPAKNFVMYAAFTDVPPNVRTCSPLKIDDAEDYYGSTLDVAVVNVNGYTNDAAKPLTSLRYNAGPAGDIYAPLTTSRNGTGGEIGLVPLGLHVATSPGEADGAKDLQVCVLQTSSIGGNVRVQVQGHKG